MARQARRDFRRHGRPSGAGSLPAVAAARAVASGSARTPTSPAQVLLSAPQTRATYRLLLLKGLAPDEAANLTAFICGIHVGSQRWKLAEVNRLLFLRELSQDGKFGGDDGAEIAASSSVS
jgi:hypothetical protein